MVVEDGVWKRSVKNSTYGKADSERAHWWYLHVTAPATSGQGKSMVSEIGGTQLLPASDGLFGTAGSHTMSSAGTSDGGPPSKRQRRQWNRAQVHNANAASANYGHSFMKFEGKSGGGQGKGNYQTGDGKGNFQNGGKSQNGKNNGKGYGKDKSKAAKGKKGGKDFTT